MSTIFEHREFYGLIDFEALQFADIEFRRCYFESSYSTSLEVQRRAVFRNVKMVNCEVTKACSLRGAVIEDVLIDRLQTHGLLQLWGCAFKHVTLRGGVGAIMLSAEVVIGPQTSAERARQRAFEVGNAAYYDHVDWALDISEAEFSDCSIRCIPGRLIHRDPETQVIVTRRKAEQGAWKELGLSESTHWPTAIEFMLEDPRVDDVVLVAPKRHRQFKELLRGLHLLRQAGVAEPD